MISVCQLPTGSQSLTARVLSQSVLCLYPDAAFQVLASQFRQHLILAFPCGALSVPRVPSWPPPPRLPLPGILWRNDQLLSRSSVSDLPHRFVGDFSLLDAFLGQGRGNPANILASFLSSLGLWPGDSFLGYVSASTIGNPPRCLSSCYCNLPFLYDIHPQF